ncbi:flotillin-like FloA family protein [Marinifilum caeruleilacunae]|uniref:Uncharacterized protein n=1 Tax=Marinifilum caeruleilacunae TaxID=2499076 RepID=A0ABX1WZX3_9BACT|nr:flotillin-like FloA family protein [Marinifilum caeruleilacunae]NOU61385.1 hypothetical protein [Marinifilum caeruleilacunae]
MENLDTIIFIAIVIAAIPLALYLFPVAIWFSALLSGVRISMIDLTFMRLRRSPVAQIIRALIIAAKGGIIIDRFELEAHALAGGNVTKVVYGMVAAKKAGLELSFQKASASDFKGIDLVKAVHKEIETRKEKEIIFE